MYKDADKLKSDYKKGKLPYPDGIPMDRGDFVKWARHFFGMYADNNALLGYGGYYNYATRIATYSGADLAEGRSISELRAYGVGMQSVGRYRKQFKGKDPKTNKKIVNISFDPPKIMAKFRDQVLGKLSDYKFGVYPIAVDHDAAKAREELIGATKLMTDDRMKSVMEMVGRPPSDAPDPNKIGVETPDDVDTLNRLGGIPLLAEIMAKDAVDSTLQHSDFEDNLESLLDEDIFDIGLCCAELRPTPDGKNKLYYVDPDKLVSRSSKYKDFRDIDFAGYIQDMSISELRETSTLDEKEIYKIAKSYANFGVNAKMHSRYAANFSSRTWREDFKRKNGAFPYDNYRVSTFRFYFKADKADFFKIGVNKFGAEEVDYLGTNIQPESEEGVVKKKKNTVYKCNWVIGTKEVFDYGICEYTDGETLPIKIWSTGTTSFVERSVAAIDDIAMAVLKQRNTLANMKPGPRIVLDTTLLRQEIKLGDSKYNMLDLLEVFSNTGVLLIGSKAEFQHMGQTASNRRPIDHLPTGIAEDLQILMGYTQDRINQIRNDTGFNEFFDGTSQNDRMLKPMIQGMNMAANNALKGAVLGKYNIFRMLTESSLHYWRMSVLKGTINVTVAAEFGFKKKKITDLLYKHSFKMKLKALPTEQERQELLAELNLKETEGQISPEDKFFIRQILADKDIHKAYFYLAKAVKRRAMEAHQRKIEEIQANGESNAAAATAAEEAKARTIQTEYDQKMKYLERELYLKDLYDEKALNRRIVEQGHKVEQETTSKAVMAGIEAGLPESKE